MDRVRQWLYYILISVISFISLVFLPMLGSELGVGWNFPDTAVGWVVYISTKVTVAGINVLIFHCFMQQAVINVAENEKYQQARQLLMTYMPEDYAPRDPKTWKKREYERKGISIFVSSVMSVFALTQAALTFDYISMLTYLFTIVLGLVFGILQMKTAEEYWTTEYYKYAIWYTKEKEKEND